MKGLTIRAIRNNVYTCSQRGIVFFSRFIFVSITHYKVVRKYGRTFSNPIPQSTQVLCSSRFHRVQAETEGFEAYSFSIPLRFDSGKHPRKHRKAFRIPGSSASYSTVEKQNTPYKVCLFSDAETEGFEPSVPF